MWRSLGSTPSRVRVKPFPLTPQSDWIRLKQIAQLVLTGSRHPQAIGTPQLRRSHLVESLPIGESNQLQQDTKLNNHKNMIDLIVTLSPIAIAPLCAIGLLMILDAIWRNSLTVNDLGAPGRPKSLIYKDLRLSLRNFANRLTNTHKSRRFIIWITEKD